MSSDELATANLYLLNPKRFLSFLRPGRDQPSQEDAKEIFGERISASINKDKNIYQLTLQNLKYNDTSLFQLEVGIKRGSVTISKTATINLLVKGMVNMIFFSSYS